MLPPEPLVAALRMPSVCRHNFLVRASLATTLLLANR